MCAQRSLVALLLIAFSLSGCASVGPSEYASVARVGDGDTLELEGGQRVRLLQIDAPELGEGECYGEEATSLLRFLVRPGTPVRLDADPELDETDRFGRLLRYVFVDDVNVNLELVRQGAATPYFVGGSEGRYARDLLAAADDARASRRGMWAVCQVDWLPSRQVETH
jgi:endonuclease YncB( thermonuclease family)